MMFPKRNHIRSKKLTDAAKGEACTGCGVNDNTIVAAHSDCGHDGKGKGIKAEDIYIAFLCGKCHIAYGDPTKLDALFQRFTQSDFDRAMKRTWKRLFEKGVIKIA
mgnify:CR=1 FL=1